MPTFMSHHAMLEPMFERRQKVYFGHTDTAGIVFNPKFVEYFQLAYEDFVEARGYSDRSMLDQVGVRLPVVHIDVDFRRPAEPGDELVIRVWVPKIGDSSITFRMQALDGDVVAADCTQVRVAVDGDFDKARVPDELREAFEGDREGP